MEAMTPSCNETLLIVDDEPLMTDMFRQYMSRRGYHVMTADSGQKALQTMAADNGQIKLIITDLAMPDIDGAELARLLQQSAPAIPVLIATGHDVDPATSDLPANVVEVIRKPYQNRLLAVRIREILDQRRQ